MKVAKKRGKREEYINKLTSKLRKWDSDLEKFEEKYEERFSELKKDFAKTMETLKQKRSVLGDHLERLEEGGEKRFKQLKKDVDQLFDDIKTSFSQVKKEIKKK